jgi:hypothetical protein
VPATAAPSSLRPPLKWAGGKRWQVPHLRPFWEAHPRSRLVEPFCGGLAVTLGLLPERALLNDANPHLINFYRWLQKGLKTDLKMENNERLFYRQRTRFNELVANGQEDTAEGAALCSALFSAPQAPSTVRPDVVLPVMANGMSTEPVSSPVVPSAGFETAALSSA